MADESRRDERAAPATSGTAGVGAAGIALSVAAEYNARGVTYAYGGDAASGGATSDCSHFVHDVLKRSGLAAPYVDTAGIAGSSSFVLMAAAEAAAGDVMVQADHMGVFTGERDKKSGCPMGVQMGTHGAANAPWGPGGWFKGGEDLRYYRPRELMSA